MIEKITKCPGCGSALEPVRNLLGGDNKYWEICKNKNCKSLVNTGFQPMDHQLDILHQTEQGGRIGAFGGYGAAKTSTLGMAMLLHNLTIPKGESLLGAESWRQLVRTNMLEMSEITPTQVLKDWSITSSEKSGGYTAIYKNGHKLHAAVLVDEENLRSMNLTGAWAEESSVVRYGVFSQLEARLRKEAGKVYDVDENGVARTETYIDGQGIMRTRPKELPSKYVLLHSSNPDPGWIRTQFLYKTPINQVHYYGLDEEIRRSLLLENHTKNSRYHSFVIPSSANWHLPKDFIPSLTSGKSKRWVDRYVNGSFTFAEGLVYPEAMDHTVEPFEIPKHWRRMISTDFGRREATAHVVGAINPENGVLYIYDCFKVSNGELSDWLAGFHKLYDPVPASAWLFPPIGDPAGESRGQADAKSWFDLYAENDIFMIPSKTGKASELGIAPGIALVTDYMSAGKIKIFNNLTMFLDEIKEYKYKTESLMELESEGKKDERPVAYNDHLMDAFRGMVSMLPRDVTFNLASFQPSYVSTNAVNSSYGVAAADVNEYEFDPLDARFWSSKSQTDEYTFDNGLSDEDLLY